MLFVQGMVADAYISENRNEKGKRQVLPQIVGKISFALMWKVDCFCCFNRTMLENIGVWTRE